MWKEVEYEEYKKMADTATHYLHVGGAIYWKYAGKMVARVSHAAYYIWIDRKES